MQEDSLCLVRGMSMFQHQLHTHLVPFHQFNNVGVQLKKNVLPSTRVFGNLIFTYEEVHTHTLKCDHKPLKPFITSGMKIQKFDRWALELSDYNLNFVHIKGNDNILADTILHLKSKNLYHILLQDPKTLHCHDFGSRISQTQTCQN